MKAKDYQSACIDYLNGHMSIIDTQNFESELKSNQVLSEELTEVKKWQSLLQAKKQSKSMPNFDAIKAKLTKSQLSWGRNWTYSLTAAVSFMFIIYLSTGSQQHTINNKFETLTSPTMNYAQPVVQIVLANNVNIEQFIADYGLTEIEKNPNSQIITVAHTSSLEGNLASLSADSRTVFVKKIEKSQ
nr:hypothetical protein [uncultured Glaciecola sp.]